MVVADATLGGLIKRTECPVCEEDRLSLWGPPLYPLDFLPLWGTYDEKKLKALLEQNSRLMSEGCRLCRCKHCGAVCSSSIPDHILSEFLYDEMVDEQKSLERSGAPHKKLLTLKVTYKLHEVFANFTQSSLNFLDVGCGWGDFMSAMQYWGSEVSGVETSEKKRQHVESLGMFVSSSIDGVNHRAPFDAILLWQVLEHVSDPVNLLRTLLPLAHSKTVLLVSVPSFSMKMLEREFQKRPELRLKDLNPLEHLNYFDGNTLTLAGERAGWERLYSYLPLFAKFPYWRKRNDFAKVIVSFRNIFFPLLLKIMKPRLRNIDLGTYAVFLPAEKDHANSDQVE